MIEDHLEIERAWILDKMPPAELITHNIPHDIGYIHSDKDGELRVVHRYHKKENGTSDDGDKYSITVKSGGTLTRNEWEDDDFPWWAFELLWKRASCSINKTRHFVNYKNHSLEIDYYNSRTVWPNKHRDIEGKIRLECEFDSEEEAAVFILPDWAEGAVEITGLEEYRNKNLAAYGWPEEVNWGTHICRNGEIKPYHALLCAQVCCWREFNKK